MSSPLSMLRKNRRAPFPGFLNEEGRRRVPFKESSYTEYEAALLRDISPRQSRPAPPATDSLSSSRSKATQKKSNTDCTPPSDFELMSTMMQKLTQLESKVKVQVLDIECKEKKIAVLEEKLKLFQKSKEKTKGWNQEEELIRMCHKLQYQVWEMETFLNDYGMIWVGSSDQQELHGGEQAESSGQFLWQPDTSVVSKFHVNFDLVLQNIQELNVLAGEGESYVKAMPGGAQLSQRSPIPLWLYNNGILMFNGPFRSYQDPSTQQCMQDLMDGYFPSELQGRFPDGVPFQVHDRREEEFKVRRMLAEFPGKGQAVVGLMEQSLESTAQAYETLSQEKSHIPGRKLSMEQFLNKLPKTVVKAGRVIDIRDSVRASLQGSSDAPHSHLVNIIETPVLQVLKERLELGEPNRSPSAADVTTLRVKSEDAEHTFILKMRFSETIGHLREYLDTHRGSGVAAYDIISAFPQRCYTDDSQTLLSCGLTPNAALLLRTQPRAQ